VAAPREEELLELAEKAVALAQKIGANEAEAFIYHGVSTSVAIERGQIAKTSRVYDGGLGLRTIVNKAVGFSYTNVLSSDAAIEETVRRAISSARAGKPDKDWESLPERRASANVRGTFDKRIVEMGSDQLVEAAAVMLSAAEQTDKRVFAVEGGVGSGVSFMAVANSNGIAAKDRGTMIECSLATLAQDAGEVTPVCFEFNLERKLNINPEWVGREAARLAVSALKATKIETKKTSVVFTQYALQQLFYYTLVNAVKADFVQRDQSAFKNKIGKKVAADTVTIIDDGLMEEGLRTWSFDGEGVPQERTPVIEKGILRSFLYDNYTARKDGRKSTGNASRAGYLSTPGVEATNFCVLPGNISETQLVRQVDDGFLAYSLQGAHSSNPASGEFSVVATPGWRIKNGEIVKATKGAMIGGDIFEVLANVSSVANNVRKIGQLVAPWVRVEGVRVIGK